MRKELKYNRKFKQNYHSLHNGIQILFNQNQKS